jgi:hypothetical protein
VGSPRPAVRWSSSRYANRASGVPAADIAWPIARAPRGRWAWRKAVRAPLMVDMSTAHLLSLASLSPLLLSQQSHAVVRSSGRSAVSSSARMSPTHVSTSYQTRLQHAPRACPASAVSVPSISGCSKEVAQAPSRARLAALLKATPRPFT